MEYKDYYATLGVAKDAKLEDVKRSYRKLARKYHPDVSKEANAEEKFKEVQEAYEVLKDPKKREAYDQLGSQWKSGQEFKPPPDWQGFGFDFGGSTDEGGGGAFSDFFERIFGGGHQSRRGGFRQEFRQRGQDQQVKIKITLEEAYKGANKQIQLQVPEVDARGQLHYVKRSLKITIPPGVIPGQQLRLAQQGAPGIGGGPSGDLYIEIEIEPHRLYTLQGRDIYLNLPVTPWEAALGSKIKIPTLGGPVELKIAPDSQTGKQLRLKGRGLPAKAAPGDQYVLLQILTPPPKTESQRSLYEKMSQDMPFNPREGFY